MNWKHILHIMRKDFCAQRFHLILWACLLIVYVAMVAQWDSGRPAGEAFVQVVTVVVHLLPGVIMIYGLLIVVVLIHQDPVAGTSGFWLTRPIRGTSLFFAKAIEAAAMVGLWFLGDLLILAGNGVTSHTGYLAFSFASGLLPPMLVTFAIAALVPNTTRFLLTIALVTVAIGVIAMLLNLVGDWFISPDSAQDASRTLGEALSAQVVGATITSLAALAILAWQFVTRRTGISILAALTAAACASVALARWSHDFIPPRAVPGDLSGQFELVKVEIDSSDLRSGFASVSHGDDAPVEYRTVSGLVSVDGLPDGVFAWWKSARTRVVTADGREFLQRPEKTYEYASSAGISSALDGASLGGAAGGDWWRAIVRTDEDQFVQFAHEPCTLESEVQLELFRYELLGELPLEIGAEFVYDDLLVRITKVAPLYDRQNTTATITSQPVTEAPQPVADTMRECEVHFSERFPNSRLKAVREGHSDRNPYSNLIYILVNRQRKEAMRSNGGGFGSYGGIRMMFHYNDRHLDFQPAYTGVAHEKSPQLDEEWLAGASLAILKRNSLGEITRTAIIKEIVFDK